MIQKLSLLAVHLGQSLTLTVLKGLQLKTKYQPTLLFIQVKTISSLYGRLQNQLIIKSQRKFLVSYICHIELIIYIRKFTILNILS